MPGSLPDLISSDADLLLPVGIHASLQPCALVIRNCSAYQRRRGIWQQETPPALNLLWLWCVRERQHKGSLSWLVGNRKRACSPTEPPRVGHEILSLAGLRT